ncbi:putative LSM domain-containing protein [Lupinus albus]|uniref:U6 snRNA-associated Sm-like protein LSm1 n=1 Tax=Lupinus albus TaxID=3870 RepID=A0A6A4QMY3_LUPAL|nr:putative LSM domain-containing protein [Lupinus albus]
MECENEFNQPKPMMEAEFESTRVELVLGNECHLWRIFWCFLIYPKTFFTMSWEGPEDIYLSTSLASYLDKKLLVLLRDGRKLMGILRSFDQFANAVLEGASERVIVGDLYCDIPLGLYVIRGENVVLIGELDLEREELPPHMTCVSTEEIKRAQKADREASDLKGTMRKRMEFLDLD